MVKAGGYLNDQNLAWFLAENIAPALNKVFNELGVELWNTPPTYCYVPGTQSLKKFRAHLAKRPNVTLLEDVLVTRLLKDGDHVSGAIALDLRTGECLAFRARVVVVATGGCSGEMFPLSSDNPFGISSNAAGAGHVLAFHSGARLVDMEQIQFVPIPVQPSAACNLRFYPEFFASPYYDRHGNVLEQNPQRFVGGTYSYEFARLVYETEKRGDGPVYIDQARAQNPDVKPDNVPICVARRARFDLLGINPFKNVVQLSVGSHFSMGGLHADEYGQTTVPGLLAAGEVAGALHGGLRLNGFSFSQMIVFGMEAGRQAAKLARTTPRPAMHDPAIETLEQNRLYRFLEPKLNALTVHAVHKQLQDIMQKHAFLVRTQEGLLEARQAIRSLTNDALPKVHVAGGKRFNLDWARAIELGYTLDASAVVVESALARRESRGFHGRADYPNQAELLPRHTVACWRDGEVKISMFAVNMCRRVPEVTA
jgi:succinate dehydrogenase/fumarate reductase flavoprotein subunit